MGKGSSDPQIIQPNMPSSPLQSRLEGLGIQALHGAEPYASLPVRSMDFLHQYGASPFTVPEFNPQEFNNQIAMQQQYIRQTGAFMDQSMPTSWGTYLPQLASRSGLQGPPGVLPPMQYHYGGFPPGPNQQPSQAVGGMGQGQIPYGAGAPTYGAPPMANWWGPFIPPQNWGQGAGSGQGGGGGQGQGSGGGTGQPQGGGNPGGQGGQGGSRDPQGGPEGGQRQNAGGGSTGSNFYRDSPYLAGHGTSAFQETFGNPNSPHYNPNFGNVLNGLNAANAGHPISSQADLSNWLNQNRGGGRG